MSIPPLVCSTPPPPEQCDDDRDAEDFDIQYNLSQDDEDDGHDYNYGTYSEYIYSTSTSSNIQQDIWSSNISKKTDKLCSDILKEKKDTISIFPDSSSINKVGFEDIVLEDLNLKLEDENDEASNEEITNKFDTEPLETDSSTELSKQIIEVADKNNDNKSYTITQDYNEATLENYDVKTFDENVESFMEATVVEADIEQSIVTNESNRNLEVIKSDDNIMDDLCSNDAEITDPNTSIKNKKDTIAPENKDLADDDFGDFDDFQFISTENNAAATITYCDNPWNSEVSKNSDFGDFTANFDVHDINLCKRIDNLEENKANEIKKEDTPNDDADDFGDFDDFKSSSNEYSETNVNKNEPSQNVPVLSLNSPDSEVQIIESINSLLSSIFTSEIAKPENDFEGKIESLLNETWGYLLDTDVRQPYIVNWNNSLGQKSLLKALCIDSRNILFGPKWNNSMPKYAANLTVAPLQPKKPVTPTSTTNVDEQNVDKTTNKETTTWTDPFTSDGQEYTYAEALLLDLEHLMATLDQMAHKNSSFKISELLTNACNSESAAAKTRTGNLDVFANVIPPEMDHIYSSTLTVQPIRQINLPDTHIFTPTDSETPRSKTIHYDQGPTMLVPQTSESSRQSDELKSKREVTVQNSENEEDYWEFQDFKGSSKTAISCINYNTDTSKATETNSLPQIVSTYEPPILQPIKVETVAPALNWPDPGEVKETFDDFSEFISNTSWSNENTNTGDQSNSPLKNNLENGIEPIEDDFEKFQSAPALRCSETSIDKTNRTTPNITNVPQNFTNSKDTLHTTHSTTDDIIVMSKENLVLNELPLTISFTTVKDCNVKVSPALSSCSQSDVKISAKIMQPSVATNGSTKRPQQRTGQILQPLSLESYSQINWPNPGIDFQDLSRFNPVESLQSLKTDHSTGSSSKLASPAHKDIHTSRNEVSDEDIWGDFVSSKPKQQQMQSKKAPVFAEDDEWTDFVSSPSVKPQNGLNTISFNVHTNLNMQKTSGPSKFHTKSNQITLDIPTLNYVTPKSSNRGLYNDKHFQNL